MKVLIDSNVLISAALYPNSTPAKAYLKAVTAPNQGIICEQNIDEARRVFNRKFHDGIPFLESFLALALLTLEIIPVPIEEEDSEAFPIRSPLAVVSFPLFFVKHRKSGSRISSGAAISEIGQKFRTGQNFGMPDLCGKKIFVTRKDDVHTGGNRRTEQRSVVLIADQLLPVQNACQFRQNLSHPLAVWLKVSISKGSSAVKVCS